MKTLIVFMLLTIFCVVPPALSGDTDLHTGTFSGTWCSYPARFDIERKDGDQWVFHGHILIRSTGQYDKLWIEQYGDNSLRIIRYLAGEHGGQTQVVETYVPERRVMRSKLYINFIGKASYGVGCTGATVLMEDAQ